MEISPLANGEEHFLIPGPKPDMRLFLRRLGASSGSTGRVVLYVHGATFPSGLSIAHRFDGRSWRDELCAAGFDVWGLDFYGFGYSDRYAEMEAPAEANPPLCLAEDAAAQLAVAVRFILEHQSLSSLSLITHSWGSMAAGRFAGRPVPGARRSPGVVRSDRAARPAPLRFASKWTCLAYRQRRGSMGAVCGRPAPKRTARALARPLRRLGASRPRQGPEKPFPRPSRGAENPPPAFVEILRAWHGELAPRPSPASARARGDSPPRRLGWAAGHRRRRALAVRRLQPLAREA